MKRNAISGSSSRDESSKSTRGEDSKNEEDRSRRRREWMVEQERQREHERLKRKKILEYEIRRAREKGLPVPTGRSSHRSRSTSPESSNRSTVASAPRTSILSEKLEPSDGTTPLFKGPEGTKASVMELRSIKVDIHRKIPGKTTTADLQRDILSPEDVVLKRRAGEGSKPIFERDEIKAAVGKDEEIEERRSVVAVRNESFENKSKTSSKYTTPSHSVRPRSCSPVCTPPHHSSCVIASQGRSEGNRKWDEDAICSAPDCVKIQNMIVKEGVTDVIVIKIAVGIKVESTKMEIGNAVRRVMQMKIICRRENIIVISRDPEIVMQENETEIRRIIGHIMMKDLIESIETDRENDLVKGETEIDPGNLEFLRHITSSKFQFQFIVAISRRGR